MLKVIINAFRVAELRKKIFFTLGIILLYRIGCFIPVPGIPFAEMVSSFEGASTTGVMALMNLFSGRALSYVSVLSLGIMPYITASIIIQLMQGVIPQLGRWAHAGETGQKKITQVTRYLTLVLGFINAIGYLALFTSSSFGIVLPEVLGEGSAWFTGAIIVLTMVAGTALIMWMGELITQRGVGNGMSLIIFANVVSGFPSLIGQAWGLGDVSGKAYVIIILLCVLAVIPPIVGMERAQRRIPVQYAKRVVGRKVMGGTSTYIPFKVNATGVIAIIFASALLYFPAQIAAFFPDVQWLTTFGEMLTNGWLYWLMTFVLIVFFSYFYTAMVFNPEDTSDNLRKQGGFIPGVRPGGATTQYIKNVLMRITLPGGIFVATIAVVPSIIFFFTNNSLIRAFGGTSILIMVGVALDTMTKLESQLKMHHYEGFFK